MAWQRTIYQGETRALSWDFASDVPDGVTLSNPTVTLEKRTIDGVSDVASGFTVSSESVSGTSVTFLLAITDSLAEGTYGLEIEVDGSDGQTFAASSGGSQPILDVKAM